MKERSEANTINPYDSRLITKRSKINDCIFVTRFLRIYALVGVLWVGIYTSVCRTPSLSICLFRSATNINIAPPPSRNHSLRLKLPFGPIKLRAQTKCCREFCCLQANQQQQRQKDATDRALENNTKKQP